MPCDPPASLPGGGRRCLSVGRRDGRWLGNVGWGGGFRRSCRSPRARSPRRFRGCRSGRSTPSPTSRRARPIERLAPTPNHPRAGFDDDALAALAESVKANGVLQPVLVRPSISGRYELIAGERRWRAAKLAGLDELPAVIRPKGDAASLELALVENMAREDLNPIEEARACAALIEELGLTREEVGRRVGRSRVAVSNLTRLLDLPD